MSDMATDAKREMESQDEPQTQAGDLSNELLSPDSAVAFLKACEYEAQDIVSKLPTTCSNSPAAAEFIKTAVRWMKTLKWALVNFASEVAADHESAEYWIHEFLSFAAPNEADVDYTLQQALKMVREGAEQEEVADVLGQAVDMFGDLMLQVKSAPVSQPVENTGLSDACVDLHQYIETEKGWSPGSFTVGVADKPNEPGALYVYVQDDKAAAEMRRTMFPHGTVRWWGYELTVKVIGEQQPGNMAIKADLRSL